MADTLGKQPRPRGRRLTVLTNAGGPGVLAADALVSGKGELATLSPWSVAQLDAFLPPQWSHANPIDILGDADPERYAKAMVVAGDEKESDGLLVILTPQAMTEPTSTAERLKPYAQAHFDKPVLASWMGGAEMAAGRRILGDAGIPAFDYPDAAARIFNYMWKYTYNLRGLYETPTLAEEAAGAHERAGEIVQAARAAGRTLLTELEAKAVLEAYGIPTIETHAGGYELIIGSSIDPQFGPVLLFGAGGVLAEAFQDRSLALPPLNTTLALRLMEQTKIFSVLAGARGRHAVDVAGLEKLLVRFSQLVVEQRAIREIEIPLLASPERLIALDARIVLHGSEVLDEDLPASAILPYPTQYIGTIVLRSGEVVSVRPIRPEDEPKMVRFHQTLSESSVYDRFAGFMKLDTRVAHERLARICFLDYDRQMALVAERTPPGSGSPELVAVARLVRLPGTRAAEFALLVSDSMQGQGLGHALLARLFDVGRDWGLQRIVAEILPGNVRMRRICASLGFTFHGKTGATRDLP
jgi:RimJ/RimL family protein N-acetyltransferase